LIDRLIKFFYQRTLESQKRRTIAGDRDPILDPLGYNYKSLACEIHTWMFHSAKVPSNMDSDQRIT